MKTAMVRKMVAAFAKLMSEGNSKLEEACRVYVKALDSSPEAEDMFKARFPNIQDGVWAQCEKVGRGLMIVELLTNMFPAQSVVERFPLAEQRDLVYIGVTAYCKHKKLRKIPVKKLSPLLVNQVFDTDGESPRVRTLVEQQRWRKEYDGVTKESSLPYRIAGGVFYILGCRGSEHGLTVTDVRLILSEMEAQVK